jgi:hypothetical protein
MTSLKKELAEHKKASVSQFVFTGKMTAKLQLKSKITGRDWKKILANGYLNRLYPPKREIRVQVSGCPYPVLSL